MGTRSGGARARGFGAEIRERRNSLGWTMDHVVAQVGMSKPTLSRIENGQRACTSHEAVSILTVLGVTGTERERLVNLTRPDDQQSWLGVGGALAQQLRTYTAFTQDATEIFDFHIALIPGILQTAEYARALISTGSLTEDVMEKTVAARLGRQANLSRPTLRRYTAFLDETSLCRTVGNSKIMVAQFAQLVRLSESARITIRIIPFSAGNHRGCDGPFSLFELDGQPRIIHIENQTTGVFIDDPEHTDPYLEIIQRIEEKALNQEESNKLLTDYQEALI